MSTQYPNMRARGEQFASRCAELMERRGYKADEAIMLEYLTCDELVQLACFLLLNDECDNWEASVDRALCEALAPFLTKWAIEHGYDL